MSARPRSITLTTTTLTLAFTLVLAGCGGGPPTEAVLTILPGDLVAGVDYDTIHIEVHERAATGMVLSSTDVTPCTGGEAGSGCKKLPLTVLLVPGQMPDVPAWIDVFARLGGADVIHDAFVFAFAHEASERYEVGLWKACKYTGCATQGESCDEAGRCVALTELADLGVPPPDLVPGDALPTPRRVFLSPPHVAGFDGGAAGANAWCNAAAQRDGGPGGEYVAVLATSTQDPVTALALAGARVIVDPKGAAVATDGTFFGVAHHMHPINVGADGTATTNASVYTGFDSSGHRVAGLDWCGDWTAGPGVDAGTFVGYADDPPAMAGFWASAGVMQGCTAQLSFYCLER